MANASGFNKDQPSGSSRLRDSDDVLRSDKSIVKATLEQEHYFNESASSTSAGIHKRGSARVHVGTASQVSTVGDDGRLMWATDTNALFYLSSASTIELTRSGHSHDDTYLKLSGTTSTVSTPTRFTSELSKVGFAVSTVTVSSSTPASPTEGLLWVRT